MRANAVFFHGLGGDAYATWQADKEDKATLWPAWLAQDIEGLSVYTVATKRQFRAGAARRCT